MNSSDGWDCRKNLFKAFPFRLTKNYATVANLSVKAFGKLHYEWIGISNSGSFFNLN